MKRVGYPEVVHPSKPSSVLSKALSSVSKRATKLDGLATTFGAIEKPSALLVKPEPHLHRSMRAAKLQVEAHSSFNLSTL